MASVTLTTLILRAREHADMVTSTFVSDAEITRYLNAGLAKLHDIVIQRFGNNYYLTKEAFVTVAGTETVALPTTFYKMLGVDLTVGGNSVTLLPFNFLERNAVKNSATYSGGGSPVPQYHLEPANMRLYPAPSSVMSGSYWFIPLRTVLSSGSDTVNFPGEWEEFAVLEAAIKCLAKEESDPSVLIMLRQEAEQRINASAENRDAGGPPQQIKDVYRPWTGSDPWGYP